MWPSPETERTILVVVCIVVVAMLVAGLTGCGHYEPPGRDIWRAL